MSNRLPSRTAIVTGASSGLGRAIALAYASEGANVVCADLQRSPRAEAEAMETTVDLINKAHKSGSEGQRGKAVFMKCDVGDEEDVKALVEGAVKEFGRLDIMVNNAGIALEGSVGLLRIHETASSTFDTTIRINGRSIFLGCKYAIAQMLKQEPLPVNARGDAERGWIINMASMLGLVGFKGVPSYCASKGVVVQLTRQVALDYAADKIHVNALCPGFTNTAMIAPLTAEAAVKSDLEQAHPWGRLGVVEDIARAAVFLASEDASWVTGVPLPVDGGYTAQ